MSVSDYLSSKADAEYRQLRESMKMSQVDRHPALYKEMLYRVYERKGFTPEECTILSNILIKDKNTVVELLLAEEDTREQLSSSPLKSAFWTFASFISFGFLPLMTYLVAPYFRAMHDYNCFWVASFLAAITLSCLGAMKAKFTGQRSISSSSLEVTLIGGTAALSAYIIAWILAGYFNGIS